KVFSIMDEKDKLLVVNSDITNRSKKVVGKDILIFNLKGILAGIDKIDFPIKLMSNGKKILSNNSYKNIDYDKIDENNFIIYDKVLSKINWKLKLYINKGQFYTPIIKELKRSTIIIFIIVIVGIISGYLISSPLAGRILLNKKELEKELDEQAEQIKKEIKTREKIFKIIGHDLRSPIAGIHSTMEHMNTNWNLFDEKEKQDLIRESDLSIIKVNNLLNSLLEWADHKKSNFEEINVIEIEEEFENIKELYYELLKAKNINFEIDYSESFKLKSNRRVFLTIIRNLISNSIKFTKENGTIKLQAFQKENKLIIQVSDTGVGISNQDLRKIFKEYEGKSKTGTKNEIGTGFGLIAVKKFADNLGCKINFNSKKKKGTVVRLIFNNNFE
ncbi:MAG: sensor histidine kinase, partial [Fusobacteriota bacterium]